MLLELTLFFATASLATTLIAVVPGAPAARFWVSLPLATGAVAAAAWVTAAVDGDRPGAEVLAALALLGMLAMRRLQPWGLLAALLFASIVLAAIGYLAYAADWTVTASYGPAVWLGSVLLLLLEIGALALTVSYAFEILDVLGRRRPPARDAPPREFPWVAIQVPTYNEPVEVVQPTLEELARLDYPNVLVQVVDNNTSDPALWQPVQRLCEQLGPRFQFIHLDPWPGFKAGACNEATRRLPPEVEVIGIVDADYRVRPGWLRAVMGHFEDPSVGFVQTSQHYREWEDDGFLRGLFFSFRYFFDVTMPARAHRNAIIFCGTMGLIRRAALERIGGWNEACITEDAEASLRMLGAGYRGVYDRRAWGAGLMPLDFDGLKKQRFRWALGGIQILRFHWRELLPFAGPRRLRLTRGQRIHYLLGSVQWFGDVLTAAFTLLLAATAVATASHHRLPLRQLTGSVLVVPIVFLLTGVARALWAMRRTTGCSWGDAWRALRCWFAMSWVVALACMRGLITSRAEFLRTPKRKEGEASWRKALRTSRAETLLAVSAVLACATMLLRAPSWTTVALGVLLLFQGWLYLNAPWASMAAEGIPLTPARRVYLESPQNTGDRPALRPTAAALSAGVALAGVAGAVALLVATGPSDTSPPFARGQSDLPRIGSLAPPSQPSPSPSPSATPSATPAESSSSSSSSSTTSSSSSRTTTSTTSSASSTSASPPASPSP